MNRPLIFSGTTEGRHMSERLSLAGIDHIVCVATGYGEIVMDRDPHADIRQGRLSESEMESLIREEAGMVFDATHPYASVVSDNILAACNAAGKRYVRILRAETQVGSGSDVRVFADSASCAEALKKTSGNVLLTTGSKELGIYAADPETADRLYVRVLPSEESIRACNEAGIRGRQIIAMQGPFTTEMDLAVIDQYGIRVLVTKSSGRTGGCEEKLEAARLAGIPAFVIGRPVAETGISVNEALSEYFDIRPHILVDLVAAGPGRGSLMTDESKEAVRGADVIFGAPRMIEPYGKKEAYPYYLARDIIPVIEERKPERIAVIFSGDTGFCSGAARMKPELEKWLSRNGYSSEIVIHPGVSAFSYLAAKAGVPYTDAGICSLHGKRGSATDVRKVIETVRHKDRTFLILSGADDVRLIGRELISNGLGGCKVILGRDLSYPEEEISVLTPEDCESIECKGLFTSLIINEGADAQGRTLIPVLRDEDFIRGKVPMTKENIRHLSVIKLGLQEESVVYDIGSGTGSVACEIASLSPGIKVYAVEMKDEACDLIRQNSEKLGLGNIEIIKGRAPESFSETEAPTHVFIGGSSGGLKEILEALRAKAAGRPEGIRVVINAVSIETIAEISSVSRELEVEDFLAEQVSVSRSRELGNYHLMIAENPVLIASFRLRGSL